MALRRDVMRQLILSNNVQRVMIVMTAGRDVMRQLANTQQ